MSASKEGIMPSFFAGAPTSSPLYQRSQIAGPIPREDGDLNWYNVPMPPPHGRPIMFVNGVNTSAIGHAQAAQSLCQITRGRVLGVYNESGSIFAGMSYEEILTRVNGSDWVTQMPQPYRQLVQGCITACLPIVRRYPKLPVDLLQCTMDFTRIMF